MGVPVSEVFIVLAHAIYSRTKANESLHVYLQFCQEVIFLFIPNRCQDCLLVLAISLCSVIGYFSLNQYIASFAVVFPVTLTQIF